MSDHAVLDAQRDRWEQALVERPDRFGVEPSAPAQDAAALFERERLHRLLELGGGQGRDSLFFARRGSASRCRSRTTASTAASHTCFSAWR